MTQEELVAELDAIRALLHEVQNRIAALSVAARIPPDKTPSPFSGGGPGPKVP